MRLHVDIPQESGAAEEDVQALIDQYHLEHPDEDRTDEELRIFIQDYLAANPVPDIDRTNEEVTELARLFHYAQPRDVLTARYRGNDNTVNNFSELPLDGFSENHWYVSDVNGFIYFFALDGSSVKIFNIYTFQIEETILTGTTYNLRYGVYNPLYHKIYFVERFQGHLISFDIATRTFSTLNRSSADLDPPGEFQNKAIHSHDYRFLYCIAYPGLEIIKYDLHKAENNIVGADTSFVYDKVSSGNTQGSNHAYISSVMAGNGCIYATPSYANKILKIDTMNGDALSYIPIVSASMTHFGLWSGRAFMYYGVASGDGRYIFIGQGHPGNYNGGNYLRLDTNDDSLIYHGYPNLLNHVGSGNNWGTIGNPVLGTDGYVYLFPARNVGGNDRAYIYDIENDTPMEEVDNACDYGYGRPVVGSDGFIYAPHYYAPYDKMLRVSPKWELKYDPKQIIIDK